MSFHDTVLTLPLWWMITYTLFFFTAGMFVSFLWVKFIFINFERESGSLIENIWERFDAYLSNQHDLMDTHSKKISKDMENIELSVERHFQRNFEVIDEVTYQIDHINMRINEIEKNLENTSHLVNEIVKLKNILARQRRKK